MFRRVLVTLAFVLMVAGFRLSAPASVLAANPSDPDGNPNTTTLAGRPITGSAGDFCSPNCPLEWDGDSQYISTIGSCHGIAYAKVGGYISLLVPYHCRPNVSFDGKYVYGPNYSKIGYYSSDKCFNNDCAGRDHDLAVIVLYQGNWPTNINRVYRGFSASENDFWIITAGVPSAFNCAGLADDSEWGDLIGQNFQYSSISTNWYRTGTLLFFDSQSFRDATHCRVTVDLLSHGPGYRDSGSPFVDPVVYDNTVSFFSSSADGINRLLVTPLKDGLDVLYNYWHNFNGTSASLCKTSGCT